jgi:hypothetical protein
MSIPNKGEEFNLLLIGGYHTHLGESLQPLQRYCFAAGKGAMVSYLVIMMGTALNSIRHCERISAVLHHLKGMQREQNNGIDKSL